MSKDLKRRGFRFVGPTSCYAFMQATGLVDDHTVAASATEKLAERERVGCTPGVNRSSSSPSVLSGRLAQRVEPVVAATRTVRSGWPSTSTSRPPAGR